MSMQEKIENVYKKKNKNYKNISLFPTIDPFTIIKKPILEGFQDNEYSDSGNDIPESGNLLSEALNIELAYVDTFNKIFNENDDDDADENGDESGNFLDGLSSVTNRIEELANSQYAAAESEAENSNTSGNSEDSDPAGIVKKVANVVTDIPTILLNIFLYSKGFIVFIINFINNVLVYFSIIFVQVVYKESPIQPFGNLFKRPTVFNWPWKLDLNVAESDNIAIDPSATLWNKTQIATGSDGTYVPGDVYRHNQEILYDSNIVFSFFIQLILVALTWVITNNLYYYIYNVVDGLAKIPYRYLQPNNTVGGINVSRGPFHIFKYSFINILISAPYDILYLLLFLIKFILQITGIYEFYALSYILLFMLVLYLTLKYFWGTYTKFVNDIFMQSNLDELFKSYFFYFLIGFYGIFQHYLVVNIVNDKNETVDFSWRGVVTFLIIIIATLGFSPFIRIFFYIWFLYIFFGFQGFTNDVYNDIIKHQKKQKCDSNEILIVKIIRNAIDYFFEYFYYFVVFMLIISNFLYFNSKVRMFNTQSSSAVKLLIGIIFLSVFMYLIYSILNKNQPKRKQTVVYGDSFLNEKEDIDGAIGKIDMKDYSAPSYSVDNEKDPTFTLKDKAKSVLKDITQRFKPGSDSIQSKPVDIVEIENSENYIDKLNVKIKKLIIELNPDNIFPEEILNRTSFLQYKIRIQEFLNILKKIEEILDDPITKELFHTPFNLTTLSEKIRIRLEKETSIPPRIKDYLNKAMLLLNEIIKQKLDENISKFLNNISEISYPKIEPLTSNAKPNVVDANQDGADANPNVVDENPNGADQKIQNGGLGLASNPETDSYYTKIKEIFINEIDAIKIKLAKVLKTVFPSEIITMQSIVQIYNTMQFKPFFIEAEPEIGILSLIVSELYPEDTKGIISKTFSSVKKIFWNKPKL